MSDQLHPSLDDLRTIPVFEDLDTGQLEWLAAHMTNQSFSHGEIMVPAGSPANFMVVLFEGEMQGRREDLGPEGPLYIIPAGRVTGKLPFSRMKEFPSTVRANGPTRVGRLQESDFSEMLRLIPSMSERLVGVLSDRIREVAKVDQNREKLAALGKLSAGLAHELNNPSSAAQRAAANLREALQQLAEANRQLATCPMTEEQRVQLAKFETAATARLDSNPVLDSLALSDREEELIAWFDHHQISNGWEIAPALADAGLTLACLDEVLDLTGAPVLGAALRRIAATFQAERLLRDIENSTSRITVLVRAIKEYSYMDRMKEQEIDVHRGIDVTLAMLNHCLKHGVTVIREYDPHLPAILANGGELNQVWTNLIDNAISAMHGNGELRIRTAHENELVLVEITDNGPGIPVAIQDRIFEPFFTTKGVGEGTGLGLDLVYRTVRRHHGDIRFTSRPGETRFQIRLPISKPANTEHHEAMHTSQ